MLWLALYCPTLPLDCILRRWPEGLEPALAVTDLDGTRRLIAVATQKAQACGVFAGQSIATALSLLPDLVLIARKLEDERSALMEAALAALRFTPTVSLRASGLVMEISASLKLFGGHRLLRKSIAAAMRVQGLAIAAAEAPTPHGAWLLARENARLQSRAAMQGTTAVPVSQRPTRLPDDFDAALAALPIAHLETARPALQRLDGIGCHSVADLRRLPVKGLARRFGPALIDELARAAGDKVDPQDVFEAPSRFATRIELMARVETAEALVFASQRLLAQMTGWLTARRAAVRGFTLMLHHDRWTRDAIEPTAVAIALASPSNDLSRLGTLVRERLSRLELKAPVLELSLEAPAIVEERETHGTLFPEREHAAETLARLLEKLTARLGPEAMSRIERVADHRPERAWREVRGDLLEQTVATRTGPAGNTAKTRAKVAKPMLAVATAAIAATAATTGHDLRGEPGADDVTDLTATQRAEETPLGKDVDPGCGTATGRDTRVASGAAIGRGSFVRREGRKIDATIAKDPAIVFPPHGEPGASVRRGRRSAHEATEGCDQSTVQGRPPRQSASGENAGADAAAPSKRRPPKAFADPISPGCACGPRPAWLLSEPQQLEVRAHRPVFEALPIELVAGPERVEGGWWDDAPATRDYYIGENAAGRLVWIYRERLLRPGKAAWYLQGLFG